MLYPTLKTLTQRSSNSVASLGEIKDLSDDTESVLDPGMVQLDVPILNNKPCEAMVGRDDDRMTGSGRELCMMQPTVHFHWLVLRFNIRAQAA